MIRQLASRRNFNRNRDVIVIEGLDKAEVKRAEKDNG
jgi:hypothetical protein